MKSKSTPVFIGRKEVISLPNLGLFNIDAKIDTGAYRSALHCHGIEVRKQGERKVLFCRFLDPEHEQYNEKELVFEEYTEAVVKNSFGQVEERYAVVLEVTIGNFNFKTQFTLTDRSELKCPVLIGRKALKKRFLVDVSKSYILNSIESG